MLGLGLHDHPVRTRKPSSSRCASRRSASIFAANAASSTRVAGGSSSIVSSSSGGGTVRHRLVLRLHRARAGARARRRARSGRAPTGAGSAAKAPRVRSPRRGEQVDEVGAPAVRGRRPIRPSTATGHGARNVGRLARRDDHDRDRRRAPCGAHASRARAANVPSAMPMRTSAATCSSTIARPRSRGRGPRALVAAEVARRAAGRERQGPGRSSTTAGRARSTARTTARTRARRRGRRLRAPPDPRSAPRLRAVRSPTATPSARASADADRTTSPRAPRSDHHDRRRRPAPGRARRAATTGQSGHHSARGPARAATDRVRVSPRGRALQPAAGGAAAPRPLHLHLERRPAPQQARAVLQAVPRVTPHAARTPRPRPRHARRGSATTSTDSRSRARATSRRASPRRTPRGTSASTRLTRRAAPRPRWPSGRGEPAGPPRTGRGRHPPPPRRAHPEGAVEVDRGRPLPQRGDRGGELEGQRWSHPWRRAPSTAPPSRARRAAGHELAQRSGDEDHRRRGPAATGWAAPRHVVEGPRASVVAAGKHSQGSTALDRIEHMFDRQCARPVAPGT